MLVIPMRDRVDSGCKYAPKRTWIAARDVAWEVQYAFSDEVLV